ncbi:MAG: tetratricopeptide repeat protein [Candidatus Krumholzibacteria bacterium]|jgi:tetratricopeptide (TPR) repeat protein|nr:tetratricopeptide repeat protein [Candidatus Krumholzibacteria bacterium]
MRQARVARAVLTLFLLASAAGCSGGDSRRMYSAEEAIFKARKMNDELIVATMNPSFLERTTAAYRAVVADYGKYSDDVEGMRELVVSAQMELAELEFRAGRLTAAREDFAAAYEMASGVPAARANALWSGAYIAREAGDAAAAIALFSRFADEYLTAGTAAATARMNRRYLLTPLRIAEMHLESGNERDAGAWLDRAERLFEGIVESDSDSSLVREAHYNLVTARLQGRRWSKALDEIERMKGIYKNDVDSPSLLFLEARIRIDGFNGTAEGLRLLDRIAADHPRSREAVSALLTAGGIHFRAREFRKAEGLYRKILDGYPDAGAALAEARWQIAQIAEEEGRWLDASLGYKSIYTDFPGTLQGMEAPLRIARHFRELGEAQALSGAWEQALAHYRKLSSDRYNTGMRIMAEEYLVRALTEQKKWKEAADHLLGLPSRYPDYARFNRNCLLAASIYEKELGDAARAAEILRDCAGRHGGTDIADEARKQLERIERLE